jgi:hypothetical protein
MPDKRSNRPDDVVLTMPDGTTVRAPREIEAVFQRFAIPPVRVGPGTMSPREPMTLALMEKYGGPDSEYHRSQRRIPL